MEELLTSIVYDDEIKKKPKVVNTNFKRTVKTKGPEMNIERIDEYLQLYQPDSYIAFILNGYNPTEGSGIKRQKTKFKTKGGVNMELYFVDDRGNLVDTKLIVPKDVNMGLTQALNFHDAVLERYNDLTREVNENGEFAADAQEILNNAEWGLINFGADQLTVENWEQLIRNYEEVFDARNPKPRKAPKPAARKKGGKRGPKKSAAKRGSRAPGAPKKPAGSRSIVTSPYQPQRGRSGVLGITSRSPSTSPGPVLGVQSRFMPSRLNLGGSRSPSLSPTTSPRRSTRSISPPRSPRRSISPPRSPTRIASPPRGTNVAGRRIVRKGPGNTIRPGMQSLVSDF